jgi:hypothetical protein
MMKGRKTMSAKLLSFAALIALAAGCNTISVSTNQSIAAPTYPPSDPATVKIIQNEEPRDNAVRLGEITLQPSGNPTKEEIRQKFQTAAAAWGANAVVIVSDRQQVLGAYVTGPWWGRQVQQDTGRVIVGVAIRYIQ